MYVHWLSTLYNMWLSLQKPSLMAHLVLWEKPIWSIEAAVVLLCWIVAMLDLHVSVTRVASYLASAL